MWSYAPYQREGAMWALLTIRQQGLAYLAWPERTRKSGTALLTAESSKATSVLIVTKKKAIPGWLDTIEMFVTTKKYKVINYESIHKVKGSYDFIILDESHHAISSTGRPSKTWKAVQKFTHKKAILYLSATPYAEHLGLIYHQLKLSTWSPFKQRNFYDWFRKYGIPHMTRTPYGLVETYTKYKDEEILKEIDHLFDFKTRKQVGIEHEPQANVVVVPMLDTTKQVIKQVVEEQMFTMGPDIEILMDSPMKLRTAHYQLEGGTLKVDDKTSILLEQHEKIDYIRNNYDEEDLAIMAHFIKERELLEKAFPKARILSSDGHAEGVDLHQVRQLIVYSMSFKTSKHTQRTARQANHNRATPIVVDILVADKPGVGKAVYDCVAIKKENFVKSSYERSIK